MQASPISLEPSKLCSLLRGEPEYLRAWIEHSHGEHLALCLGVIVTGAGLYGAAIGSWRAPLGALFVGVKLPMIILLTALGNALLNAMLAPLLGLNLGLRQSFLAILMSFTMASAILGAFSPLAAFMIWNMPPLVPGKETSSVTYSIIQLSLVAITAFAGIVANLRLVQLLQQLSGNVTTARRVLVAWLAGNLFLGSQLAWIFRPFIGSPDLPVVFVRPTAFQGNFYETVFHSVLRVLQAQ
jgi:hypothetical protein